MKKYIIKFLKRFYFFNLVCQAIINERSEENFNFLNMNYNERVKVIKNFHSLEQKKTNF